MFAEASSSGFNLKDIDDVKDFPWGRTYLYHATSTVISVRLCRWVTKHIVRTNGTRCIDPEQVPVQYGGLGREGEQEFTIAGPATEDTIKPSSKHTVEFPVTEKSNLVREARVIGCDVSYGDEFMPSAEGGYTIIIEKSRKIAVTNETTITNNYMTLESGKVVLTFDNQTSKRKKFVYRSKTKFS